MNLQKMIGTLAFCAVLAAAMLVPSILVAGEDPAPAEEQQSRTIEATFTAAQLAAYIDAMVRIMAVRDEMMPYIDSASSEEQQEIGTEMLQKQMLEIIQKTDGVTVEEFNLISMAAAQNEDLSGRLQAMLAVAERGDQDKDAPVQAAQENGQETKGSDASDHENPDHKNDDAHEGATEKQNDNGDESE